MGSRVKYERHKYFQIVMKLTYILWKTASTPTSPPSQVTEWFTPPVVHQCVSKVRGLESSSRHIGFSPGTPASFPLGRLAIKIGCPAYQIGHTSRLTYFPSTPLNPSGVLSALCFSNFPYGRRQPTEPLNLITSETGFLPTYKAPRNNIFDSQTEPFLSANVYNQIHSM